MKLSRCYADGSRQIGSCNATIADLPIGPRVESAVALTELAAAVPVRIAPAASADVVHVPYTYFPNAVGGTEVYVVGLEVLSGSTRRP